MKPTTTLFLALFLLLPAARADEPPAAPARPDTIRRGSHIYKEQSGDLPNFHQVHRYLYRGGEPTAAGLSKLKEMGVSTIIDLRGHRQKVSDEATLARKLGMKTINLPMSSKAPTKAQVKTFIDTVRQARAGRTGPTFVHCAHGSDRTGCMVGIWRVAEDGWDYDRTYKEMRKYYFGPKYTELSGAVRKYAAAPPGTD